MAGKVLGEHLADAGSLHKDSFPEGKGTIGQPPVDVVFYAVPEQKDSIALPLEEARLFEEQRVASGSKG